MGRPGRYQVAVLELPRRRGGQQARGGPGPPRVSLVLRRRRRPEPVLQAEDACVGGHGFRGGTQGGLKNSRYLLYCDNVEELTKWRRALETVIESFKSWKVLNHYEEIV